MTKQKDLSKSLCCACASYWWCFLGWILLKSYWLCNKTLEIRGVLKGKPTIAYQKYVINDCYDCWALVNRFNHTSWVTAVTPTDRPKSVRNSCVIKVFGGVFMLSRCFLDCSVGVGVFVTGLSQISSFFSCWTVLRLDEDDLWLVIRRLWIWFHGW